MKICSLYGAGFYYIPGTDMCLKIGGWVRAEYMWGVNGSTVATWVNDVNNRNTNNLIWRSRGYITADARNQSEYGTIRSYIAVGLSTTSAGLDNAANQFDANRAFIQFAGFTFGKSQSFYEYYNSPAVSYYGNYPDTGTGDPGWLVLAYTAQFGGGLSATLSAEQRRMTQIVNQNVASAAGGSGGNVAAGGFSTAGSTTSGAGAYGGWQVPDIVGNLRLDQPWGGAQIMGALHQVNAGYYLSADEASGHPKDAWGWVIGAGARINTPFIGAGDYFQAQVNYTQGALRYIFFNPNGNHTMGHGNSFSHGILSDGVYGGLGAAATDVELTTAWSVNASYEHFWAKNWRTSAYGGYAAVSYGSRANAMLCSELGAGAGAGAAAVAVAGCNTNWNVWWIGSRTQWNITPDTYLGLDVVYERMHTMGLPAGFTWGGALSAATTSDAGASNADQSNWSARFRVHRDFYP